jgi:hypothetical protein
MDVSITTDAAGGLYIAYTSSTVRVQKLNAERDLEWSITIDNVDGWSRPYVAVDSTGVVYMAYEITAAGEVCVAKLAADGSAYLWNRSYGDLGAESSAKLAIDGSGNIILVFATTGEISGGTVAGGGSDVAVFKLNPDGDVLWSLQHPTLNTPGEDTEPTVAVAPSGALIVSYQTTDSPAGGAGMMTASIVPTTGAVTWTRSYPEANPNNIPCFLAETPIRTRRGVVPIREVVVGDEVMTGTEGVGWVTVRSVRVTPTVASAVTVPYIIPRGWQPIAGGRRKALERFYISPNHCVAIPGRGMVRAAELGLKRLERFRDGEVFQYYNLQVDRWENIIVCGLEVESLAPNQFAQVKVSDILAELIKQYGGVDRIPYAKCFKRIHLKGDGTAIVSLRSKEAIARRTAIAQALMS